MKKHETCSSRMGRVGGQAVLEGVMMKSGDNCATACRKADGSIAVSRTVFVSARKKNKFCALPLVRGVVNFVEMMKLSMSTLNQSAEMMGETDEPETKFETWLREKLHINPVAVVSALGIVLGVALSVFLFIYLPRLISSLVLPAAAPGWRALMEGGVKVALFVGYIALVSLMRDMRRVFCYHGAELLFDIVQLIIRILYYIMQKGSSQCFVIHLQSHKDADNTNRMDNIRFTGFTCLRSVRLGCQLIGLTDKSYLLRRKIFFYTRKQFIYISNISYCVC